MLLHAPGLRAEEADALAVHGRVTGPKHGAIAVVRMLAAVERVSRPVVGSREEPIVPFVAEEPVGGSAAPAVRTRSQSIATSPPRMTARSRPLPQSTTSGSPSFSLERDVPPVAPFQRVEARAAEELVRAGSALERVVPAAAPGEVTSVVA